MPREQHQPLSPGIAVDPWPMLPFASSVARMIWGHIRARDTRRFRAHETKALSEEHFLVPSFQLLAIGAQHMRFADGSNRRTMVSAIEDGKHVCLGTFEHRHDVADREAGQQELVALAGDG